MEFKLKNIFCKGKYINNIQEIFKSDLVNYIKLILNHYVDAALSMRFTYLTPAYRSHKSHI